MVYERSICMSGLNKVILIGRPTTDLVLKTTSSGKSMVSFILAVDETKEKTNFINCVVFGQSAEYLNKYLKPKGRVNVNGILQNNNYEKDGVKVYSYNVVSNDVKILDYKDTKNSEEVNPFIDSEVSLADTDWMNW